MMRPDQAWRVGVVSLRVGLVTAQSVSAVGPHVMLKWPNDIMLQNKKLGGVLCESQWEGQRVEWVVAGVGINIHGPVPRELGSGAIALDDMVDGVSRLAVLDELVPALHRMPRQAKLGDAECAEYGARDWLAGRKLTQPVIGVARGVQSDGALLVETDRGLERVVGGSVVTA